MNIQQNKFIGTIRISGAIAAKDIAEALKNKYTLTTFPQYFHNFFTTSCDTKKRQSGN